MPHFAEISKVSRLAIFIQSFALHSLFFWLIPFIYEALVNLFVSATPLGVYEFLKDVIEVQIPNSPYFLFILMPLGIAFWDAYYGQLFNWRRKNLSQ